VAILCYAALAIVLALTGTFAELVVLSTLAIAAVYIAGCAASWTLARRGVALSGTPLNFRFLGAAAFIGISSMGALIALGSRQEIIGLATLIGLSVLLISGPGPQRPGQIAVAPACASGRTSARGAYLVAITMDSTAVSGTTEVFRKPVVFIQPRQSAAV
jgi:hypothetical protein